MKNIKITSKQLLRLVNDLKQIEKWRGDAYTNDDDIGYAMQDMKVLISTLIYGDTCEVCSHCETEQDINKVDAPCPNCGKPLIACSLCNMEYNSGCAKCDCANCEDGTSSNFDMNWDEITPAIIS